MITIESEKVTSFFAEIGFAADVPGTDVDLVIDRFDRWTNSQDFAVLTSICNCVVDTFFDAA